MEDLKITHVKFRFRKKTQSLNVIANVTIQLNNIITIEDIRFLYNPVGDFYSIQMPSRKVNGEYYSVVSVSDDLRKIIIDSIKKQYEWMQSSRLWIAD